MGISGVDMESCVTEAAGLLGYESLKDKQRDCIIGFLNRRDVFAVLPTGFGKTASCPQAKQLVAILIT